MTTATPATAAELRYAELQQLATALNEQRTRSIDVVVPAARLKATLGAIELNGIQPVVSDDGVTNVDGFYTPTAIGDEGLAQKLDIPVGYLRRCHTQAVDLYDANVTGWLQRNDKSYLLRLLTHPDGPRPDGSAGVLRAFLSGRYKCIDNFDVLLAALRGLGDAGVNEPIIDADLTDRRMVVRVTAPEIAALAPKLLEGYRNPWTGQNVGRGWTPEAMARHNGGHGPDDPVVFAGFVITNSETGGGRFQVTPRLVVKICNNGLTITADALSNVHIGGELDEGVVRWSDATLSKNLELVTAKTADAVRTFLDPDYVQAKIANLEAQAGVQVEDPTGVIAAVSKRLGFSEAEQTAILGSFIRGGQLTAAGVMNAVTATAQTLDAERAYELENAGVPALEAAAAAGAKH